MEERKYKYSAEYLFAVSHKEHHNRSFDSSAQNLSKICKFNYIRSRGRGRQREQKLIMDSVPAWIYIKKATSTISVSDDGVSCLIIIITMPTVISRNRNLIRNESKNYNPTHYPHPSRNTMAWAPYPHHLLPTHIPPEIPWLELPTPITYSLPTSLQKCYGLSSLPPSLTPYPHPSRNTMAWAPYPHHLLPTHIPPEMLWLEFPTPITYSLPTSLEKYYGLSSLPPSLTPYPHPSRNTMAWAPYPHHLLPTHIPPEILWLELPTPITYSLPTSLQKYHDLSHSNWDYCTVNLPTRFSWWTSDRKMKDCHVRVDL